MNTSPLSDHTEFQWLNLSAKLDFKTVSSVSFNLEQWTNRHPSGGGTWTGVGWIDVHRPIALHPVSDESVAFVRLSLPREYLDCNQKGLANIRELISDVFDLVGLSREQPYRGRIFSGRRRVLPGGGGLAVRPLFTR
jgi:hypothetical protein